MQQVHTGFTFGFDKGRLTAIESGVKRATGNLKVSAASVDAFQQRMGGFLARAKGVIGAYLGFRAVRSITGDYAQAADTIAKFSNGLGINAQQYQRMTHAAQLSGVTVQELQVALPNLAKRLGDAADGSKEAALAFSRAGVELKDSSGKIKDPIQVMMDLADGMKGVDKTGRRTQVLMSLFGRAGKKMGVLLSQGSEGIKKAMAEADKLGIVLSQKQLKAAENYNDEMLRVRSVMLGIRNTIASKVLPAITRQLRAFQTWWREGRNAERAMHALKIAAFFAAVAVGRVVTGMMVKQFAGFTRWILSAARALKAFNIQAAIAAWKVMLVVAGLALIVLAIEDLIGFAQGKDSVIGRLLGDSKLGKELKEALISVGREAKRAWADLKPALLEAWESLKPALRELGGLMRPLAGPAFRAAIHMLIVAVKVLHFWIVAGITQIKLLQAGYESITKTVQALAKWLGIDLAVAAANVGKAWHAGLRAIKMSMGPLIAGLQHAINLKNKLFGVEIDTQALQQQTAAIRGQYAMTLAPVGGGPGGGPTMFLPPQIAAAAGVGQGPVNTTVSEGAIKVTVNATGDPAQIAAQTNAQIVKSLNRVITNASRDIKRPPAGQR
jgi:hypothetical protein